MKITIQEIGEELEEEIVLKCHRITDELLRLVGRLKSAENGFVGIKGDEIHRLSLNEIYYFEVVDNRSFIYCHDCVYESKLKLYEFERLSGGSSFFRASKSVILNAEKIDYITPSLSGRFEAKLLNKETVIVSRKYVSELKAKIGV